MAYAIGSAHQKTEFLNCSSALVVLLLYLITELTRVPTLTTHAPSVYLLMHTACMRPKRGGKVTTHHSRHAESHSAARREASQRIMH